MSEGVDPGQVSEGLGEYLQHLLLSDQYHVLLGKSSAMEADHIQAHKVWSSWYRELWCLVDR